MKVDLSQSKYHEDPEGIRQYNRTERKRLRLLLRRLRFLEAKVRESGGLTSGDGSGGDVFAELESDALEYVLYEMEFILDPDAVPAVSGNLPAVSNG